MMGYWYAKQRACFDIGSKCKFDESRVQKAAVVKQQKIYVRKGSM